MEKLLIATYNRGKFQQIKAILDDLPFEIVGLNDLEVEDSDFEEIYETYAENAMLKAQYYSEKTGFLTLADDSGIEVDVLEGELGAKTRRWGAGADATDEEWIEHFLKVMKDVPEEKRTGRFLCYAAVVDPGEKVEEKVFKGVIEGKITHELEAPIIPGLPLSSCFRPDGFDKVIAGLEEEDRTQINHRGKAISKAKEYLMKVFKLYKNDES